VTALLGILLVSSISAFALSDALARPVRVGRYTEIAYGIPNEPWVTAGGGPRRSGRSRFAAPTAEPTLAFETALGASRPSAPVVLGDGRLYVATSRGITALAPDGAQLWSQVLGFVAATPALTPTRDLVVGTNAGGLIILGPDHETRARTAVGGAVRSSPLVLEDGSIVVTAFDQAVHRFDAEGRRIFRVSMNAQTSQPPAWTDEGLLLVPAGDWLHVLSHRGDRLASHTVGATIVGGPLVADDGMVWLVAHDGSVHQLSPRGGRRMRADLGIAVSPDTGIAIGSDGSLRIPIRDDGVVCVGPTGTERWRVSGEGGFPAGVTVDAANVTLAVSESGRLVAIDGSGTIVWRVDINGATHAAPVLGADGTIYVVKAGGSIQAWR
jgi:hypothetical protein